MGILSGIVSYLFGLALNLLDAAIDGFLGALGFDLNTFEQYFPAAADFHDVIIGFAVGLLFIMLVFQIFRNFGVMLDMEAEDPLKMLGKTALFFGMIVYSRSIIDLILGLMADPYAIFLNAAPTPYQFELSTLVTAIFNSVFSNPFMNIVAVILMLVMGWQFLKLTVECVERYIVFYFALYCAPVVFATGAFKSTAQILKSWCRLVASQAMLLLINIWSIKLFLSFMPVFEQSGDQIIFTFLMGYAFLKFAQKADTLLRILGLNTASTGDMVRSLGGTIAGIAMTIRSAAGMASAVGKHFSGAGFTAGKTAGTGSSTDRSAADEISGMGSRRGESGEKNAAPSSSAQEPATAGGVTLSGITAAKQGFVADVMRAARSRMDGGPFTIGEPPAADNKTRGVEENGQKKPSEVQEEKIPLEQGTDHGKTEAAAGFRNLDEETLDGLSNLAHGLPYDKFDPEKGTFSGGGFPAFTGEDANLIGASQLTPAEGVERSMLKRADGSTDTVYRRSDTGEAHMVQFSSVDNGVIQGAISKIDPATGKMGETQSFKAVHSSVPGAESFSSHTVPVRDPSGGVYHVATKADTTIFSAANNTGTMSGSSYTPGGSSKMSAAADGITTAFVPGGNAENTGVVTAVGGSSMAGPAQPQPAGGGGTVTPPAIVKTNPSQEPIGESNIHEETVGQVQHSAEAPPIAAGMQPANQIRRFSKNNPANLEVFRRDGSRIEAFEKSRPDSEPGPAVAPPKKK